MPEEKTFTKQPPHSEEAEQSVIGSMMIDAEAVSYAAENLSPDDFYSRRHSLIFEALCQLYRTGRACDLVTLKSQLDSTGHLEEAGDIKYLGEIAVAVPTAAHVRNYVKIVKDNALYRRFIALGNQMVNEGYSTGQTIEELSETVEQNVYRILRDRSGSDFRPLNEVMEESFQDMQAAYQNGGALAGIPSGFADLDRMTSGFNPSDLILLGARPAMGKTAFGLNVLTNIAVKQHKICAVFSLEMSAKQIANRIIASYAGVELGNIRTGRLENDWQKLAECMRDFQDAQIYVDDTGGITLSEVRTKCRKLKLEKGLDFVMIDYLQLMSGSGRSGENRQQEIAEISRGLKTMARELEIPILALSQLSRGLETRPDHRPVMSDLRESGAIEQDADIVMFLYRDEYYHPDTEDKNIAEIIIGKQRNGPTGTAKLRFDGVYTRFANLKK